MNRDGTEEPLGLMGIAMDSCVRESTLGLVMLQGHPAAMIQSDRRRRNWFYLH
jgi:hypothetical protein